MDKIESIITIVADYLDLQPSDIHLKTREKNIVFARQLCHYLALNHTNLKPCYIAKRIGNKDRVTVLHSNKVMSDYLQTDKSVVKMIDELDELIQNDITIPEKEIKEVIHKAMVKLLSEKIKAINKIKDVCY